MHSQRLDTLVNVGGYNMRFNIIKGIGTPILFEAGAGNDSSVWKNILYPIYKETKTTLITYDRSGFGKSELNPNQTDDSKFGIINGVNELEVGLKKLGYDKEIILVSHSYGGLYNLLYASKHPNKIKYMILIDATINSFWTDELLSKHYSDPLQKRDYKKRMGLYYLEKNFKKTAKIMRTINYPINFPIINIYARAPVIKGSEHENINRRWNNTHEKFGNIIPNVKAIIAKGSGHFISQDKPKLVINTIVNAYKNR